MILQSIFIKRLQVFHKRQKKLWKNIFFENYVFVFEGPQFWNAITPLKTIYGIGSKYIESNQKNIISYFANLRKDFCRTHFWTFFLILKSSNFHETYFLYKFWAVNRFSIKFEETRSFSNNFCKIQRPYIYFTLV